MKRLNYLLMLGICSFLAFSLVSCDDDDDDDDTTTEITLTQEMLNNANIMQRELTGAEIQDFPHNGSNLPGDSTIRVVYTNFDDITKTATPGDVIVKHTYLKDENGEKGDLQVTFAMVKREAGYDPDASDWEWVQMPNDAGNDFGINPNGLLDSAAARGKLDGCKNCHSGGTNYRFVVSK